MKVDGKSILARVVLATLDNNTASVELLRAVEEAYLRIVPQKSDGQITKLADVSNADFLMAASALLPVTNKGTLLTYFDVLNDAAKSSGDTLTRKNVCVHRKGDAINIAVTHTDDEGKKISSDLDIGMIATLSVVSGSPSISCGMMLGSAELKINSTPYGLFISHPKGTQVVAAKASVDESEGYTDGFFYTPWQDEHSLNSSRLIALESIFTEDLKSINGEVVHIDEWHFIDPDTAYRDVQSKACNTLSIQRYLVEFEPGSLIPSSHNFSLFSV